MSQAHQTLFDEFSKLPLEKVGKALSYIRFLEQEPEIVLWIDPEEEEELNRSIALGEYVDASVVLAQIMELPDDQV